MNTCVFWYILMKLAGGDKIIPDRQAFCCDS
jgi:hypothetical protein